MTNDSDVVTRREAEVQARSADLRRELSLWDLVFAQILFIVGRQDEGMGPASPRWCHRTGSSRRRPPV